MHAIFFILLAIVILFAIVVRVVEGRPAQRYAYADGSSGGAVAPQHECVHHGDGGGHGGCDGGGGH